MTRLPYPLMIPPSRSLASHSPDKTFPLHRGVLNGYVYDRISSVIKKALQCVSKHAGKRIDRLESLDFHSEASKVSRLFRSTRSLPFHPLPLCVYSRSGKRDSWKFLTSRSRSAGFSSLFPFIFFISNVLLLRKSYIGELHPSSFTKSIRLLERDFSVDLC